jgi:hypothetical protein
MRSSTRHHQYNTNSISRIDNTPLVYDSLLAILNTQNPSSIAVNVSPDISFSSGLHVGELSALSTHLGEEWTSRFVSVPMVVEFVASKVPEQLEWYRKLQSTAWAMIEEAFSEKVITPGNTTTEVTFQFHPFFLTLSPSPSLLSSSTLNYCTSILTDVGCRMAPPFQAPRAKLHNLVPPRRHNPHLPPSPLLPPFPTPLSIFPSIPPPKTPTRPLPPQNNPVRRPTPRRLRPHSPRSKHRHTAPSLCPAPLANLSSSWFKRGTEEGEQTARHRAREHGPRRREILDGERGVRREFKPDAE